MVEHAPDAHERTENLGSRLVDLIVGSWEMGYMAALAGEPPDETLFQAERERFLFITLDIVRNHQKRKKK